MTEQEVNPKLEETRESLHNIQSFNAEDLAQVGRLGELNFSEVVAPAQKIIQLYKTVPLEILNDFPDNRLDQIKNRADVDLGVFQSILGFSTQIDSPHQQKENLIKQVRDAYQPIFDTLIPFFGFALFRSGDYEQYLENERDALIAAKSELKDVIERAKNNELEVGRVLNVVREAAAEEGVSQQAGYFKDEADTHGTEAGKWLERTTWLAIGLGVYSVLSIFVHKWKFLAPSNSYDTIQLAVSKILIFAVLSYMLYLSARNFLSHKHNAVINRHRENALKTFQAIANAAGNDPRSRDIILNQAATCIFSPQSTGYTTDGGVQVPSAKSVVELLASPLSKGEG